MAAKRPGEGLRFSFDWRGNPSSVGSADTFSLWEKEVRTLRRQCECMLAARSDKRQTSSRATGGGSLAVLWLGATSTLTVIV